MGRDRDRHKRIEWKAALRQHHAEENQVHPILANIPWLGLPIYSYGTMLGISFILGWYLTTHLALKVGISREVSAGTLTVAIIGAILGARILYFLANPGSMTSLMDFFAFNQGGLVAYGGFIGGFGAAALNLKRHKVPLFRFSDSAAPAMALGTALTRVGCLLYGCCYGAVTSSPWGITFPAGSPSFNHQAREGLIDGVVSQSLPVHPTQIYESLYGLFILGILMIARRWKKRFEGFVFLLFVALYAIFRFLNEFLRWDSQRGFVGPLSTSQLIGIVVLLLAMFGMYVQYRRVGLNTGSADKGLEAAVPATASPGAASTRKGGGRRGQKRRKR